MKPITIKPQTQPKSVFDLTVWELSQVDEFQNRNRGFEDRDDEYFWRDEDEN